MNKSFLHSINYVYSQCECGAHSAISNQWTQVSYIHGKFTEKKKIIQVITIAFWLCL